MITNSEPMVLPHCQALRDTDCLFFIERRGSLVVF